LGWGTAGTSENSSVTGADLELIDHRSNRNIKILDRGIVALFRYFLVALGFGVGLATATFAARCAEQRETETLRVAYDVPPYGYVDADGSISGVSVDLWRRVAEQMEWPFRLIPVSDMETILSGLEQGRFDAAIGAITITPERAARVDFSYPTHRSGVAIALRKETGPLFALMSYGAAISDLSPLILIILAMLVLIGVCNVDSGTASAFRRPRVGVLSRQFARRPLLGRRDNDDRRLRGQDAKNNPWPRRHHLMDVKQPRTGIAIIDQPCCTANGRTR